MNRRKHELLGTAILTAARLSELVGKLNVRLHTYRELGITKFLDTGEDFQLQMLASDTEFLSEELYQTIQYIEEELESEDTGESDYETEEVEEEVETDET